MQGKLNHHKQESAVTGDMNDKRKWYKIRDAADFAGLSVNGVRYYEEKGIVNPIWDGNYRYYDIVSLSELIRANNYRDMGFSVSDTEKLTHCESRAELKDALFRRYSEIEEEIKEKEQLREVIGSRIRQLNEIDIQLGHCTLPESKEYVMKPVQRWENDGQIKTFGFHQNYTCYAKWGPQTAPSLHVDLAEWEKDGDIICSETGPGIEWDRLDRRQQEEVEKQGDFIRFPASTCIYTVACLEDGKRLKREYFCHVREYAEKRNLVFTGDIHTCRIAAIQDKEEVAGFYVQAWFPVMKANAY